MKKLLLFVLCAVAQTVPLHAIYPFEFNKKATKKSVLARAFTQPSWQDDFNKNARIILRFGEACAGVGLGVWGLREAAKPGFMTEALNSVKTFVGISIDSRLKPSVQGGVYSTNKTVCTLLLAAVLLKDGLTGLNEELNS